MMRATTSWSRTRHALGPDADTMMTSRVTRSQSSSPSGRMPGSISMRWSKLGCRLAFAFAVASSVDGPTVRGTPCRARLALARAAPTRWTTWHLARDRTATKTATHQARPRPAPRRRRARHPRFRRSRALRTSGGWGIRTPEGFHPTRLPIALEGWLVGVDGRVCAGQRLARIGADRRERLGLAANCYQGVAIRRGSEALRGRSQRLRD